MTLHAKALAKNSETKNQLLYYHPNSHHVATKKNKRAVHADDDGGGEGAEEDEEGSPSSGSRSRYCLPCPLILNLPKVPLQTLYLQVQKQYTISKKEMENRHLSAAAREELVSVPVRIMGSPNDLSNVYFVAKDVCLLVFVRKGNVSKVIGQFATNEKARLPVLCPRSNGTSSTHVLTALSLAGLKRLLGSSKSPLASHVLKFLLDHLETLATTIKEAKSHKATPTFQDTLTKRMNIEDEKEEAREATNEDEEENDEDDHAEGDEDVDSSSNYPSYPLVSQFPPKNASSSSKSRQPVIFATITPSSLTIVPSSPSAAPTKIVVD